MQEPCHTSGVRALIGTESAVQLATFVARSWAIPSLGGNCNRLGRCWFQDCSEPIHHCAKASLHVLLLSSDLSCPAFERYKLELRSVDSNVISTSGRSQP